MSNYGRIESGGAKTFFGIRTGKDSQGRTGAVLATTVDESHPDAIPTFKVDGSRSINAKTGKPSCHAEYDFLVGRITKLEKRVWEFQGKKRDILDIHLDAPGETMILSIDRGSPYWVDFLCRLLNVDLENPVFIRPYKIERKDKPGKYNEVLGIYQNPASQKGTIVPSKWTAANNWGNDNEGKGGLPPAVPPNADNDKWSFTRRDRWLEENVGDHVAKELEAMAAAGDFAAHTQAPATSQTTSQNTSVQVDQPSSNQEDDDLPF